MPPATRFYERLLADLIDKSQDNWVAKDPADAPKVRDQQRAYEFYIHLMMDPNTKRILFDSRQAKLFDDIDEEIPAHIARKIELPFDQFYLEFTEPIALSEQEEGYYDVARCMLLSEERMECTINGVTLPVRTLIMILRDQDGKLVDRSWHVSLEAGIALSRASICRTGYDPSEIPDDWPDDAYVACNMKIASAPDRHIGWWERLVDDYTSLFMWMMAYMMAKSIHVVEEPLSRQVRRWQQRQKELPKPWHVVVVEPKFYAVGKDPEAEGTGTRHSYRYDVIGHLRFGRHKTKDGYSETIEWVPPHQRGLANALYIPKTYRVEGGKQISPRMKEYFPDPPS